MSTLETAAYLHAHGLDIDAGSLDEALRAAIAADGPPTMYGISGQEGLTTAEIAVLHEGGAVTDAPAQGASDPQVDAIVLHARLLATGFTTQAVAKHLGVSDARVRQRIEEGSLL